MIHLGPLRSARTEGNSSPPADREFAYGIPILARSSFIFGTAVISVLPLARMENTWQSMVLKRVSKSTTPILAPSAAGSKPVSFRPVFPTAPTGDYWPPKPEKRSCCGTCQIGQNSLIVSNLFLQVVQTANGSLKQPPLTAVLFQSTTEVGIFPDMLTPRLLFGWLEVFRKSNTVKPPTPGTSLIVRVLPDRRIFTVCGFFAAASR